MTGYAAIRMRRYMDDGLAAMICEASPHRLITMLFDGALQRLALAASGIERADVNDKLRGINGAFAIIEHLRLILDHEQGGPLAGQLDSLYDYMLRRLLVINASNDQDALREVTSLLQTIKSGWDEIGLRNAA